MLLPCGAVESADLQDLACALGDRGISVTIAKPIPVPRQAFTARRQQYRADDFLKAARCPAGELVLVMSDCDLYVDGLNFVLGLADGPGNCAVISLCRLRLGVNQETFRQRTLMEAVHELGHLLGLDHCARCIVSCASATASMIPTAKRAIGVKDVLRSRKKKFLTMHRWLKPMEVSCGKRSAQSRITQQGNQAT